ncbi:MAG: magnesium transporter [Clostridia bacterium]|nr:magnesium transporter [Clostridia bacterium]
MTETNIRAHLLELLRGKRFSELRDMLDEMNPVDIAEQMEELVSEEEISGDELPMLFRILPKNLAADVFAEMDGDMQELLIRSFSDRELKEVIDDMYLDDAVDLIEEMPAIVVGRILKNVDAETRKSINQLLNYPEDSAGSIMTIEYVSLKKEMTVQEAFARIRQTGVDKETIYTCYVTDGSRRLIGLVSVRDLLLADYENTMEEIMETNIISVNTSDDKELVAQTLSKYGFFAIPVVDGEMRLVGIVTVDDAMDVMQEEATEDIEKMAAITPSDKPYLKTGVWETWKQRVPWLLLLMVSATFTSIIIKSFEEALAAQVVLTAFIPMLMDTGGNCGGQASVTIIRALSTGDVEFSDLLRVVWKELRVALACGVTLAAVSFGKLLLLDRVGTVVALVVSLTLATTIFFAKIIGCTLPMLAKKVGFDPAVMASPLITTIVDAISLSVYFRFATMILKI